MKYEIHKDGIIYPAEVLKDGNFPQYKVQKDGLTYSVDHVYDYKNHKVCWYVNVFNPGPVLRTRANIFYDSFWEQVPGFDSFIHAVTYVVANIDAIG